MRGVVIAAGAFMACIKQLIEMAFSTWYLLVCLTCHHRCLPALTSTDSGTSQISTL